MILMTRYIAATRFVSNDTLLLDTHVGWRLPVALARRSVVTMAVGRVRARQNEGYRFSPGRNREMAGMDILCSDKTGTLTRTNSNWAARLFQGEQRAGPGPGGVFGSQRTAAMDRRCCVKGLKISRR